MHYRLSEKACSEYLSTGKLPSTIRPQYCQACGAKEKFHRHSSYHRKKVYVRGQWFKGGLYIQRFLCTACEKVFSLIPLFLYKWQQASLWDQESVVLERIKEIPGFSKRTLSRWKKRWRERAVQCQQTILRFVLLLKADLSLDAGAKQTENTYRYLRFVYRQLPENMPLLTELLSMITYDGQGLRNIPHNLSDSQLLGISL